VPYGKAALRYFDVAGSGDQQLRDVGLTNLVPRLSRAAASPRGWAGPRG
jgi:hypothetical protein